jgi:UDP-N-acetylmuramate--alanine ligase
VHFIGIGGAGMSAIALVLARLGVHVTGSDL